MSNAELYHLTKELRRMLSTRQFAQFQKMRRGEQVHFIMKIFSKDQKESK